MMTHVGDTIIDRYKRSGIPFKVATIEELKEIHLLLNDLTTPYSRIVQKMMKYEDSSFKLGPAKEMFS